MAKEGPHGGEPRYRNGEDPAEPTPEDHSLADWPERSGCEREADTEEQRRADPSRMTVDHSEHRAG
jgi:hypothetical protein